MSDAAIQAAGVFEPRAIQQLWRKCRARKDEGQFSNTDNMAIVGVLSTQLLHAQFVQEAPPQPAAIVFRTHIDRLAQESSQ
jgi:asparagine synthase (glutamine-hydrolysing)